VTGRAAERQTPFSTENQRVENRSGSVDESFFSRPATGGGPTGGARLRLTKVAAAGRRELALARACGPNASAAFCRLASMAAAF
jgi:hypothetical protein